MPDHRMWECAHPDVLGHPTAGSRVLFAQYAGLHVLRRYEREEPDFPRCRCACLPSEADEQWRQQVTGLEVVANQVVASAAQAVTWASLHALDLGAEQAANALNVEEWITGRKLSEAASATRAEYVLDNEVLSFGPLG